MRGRNDTWETYITLLVGRIKFHQQAWAALLSLYNVTTADTLQTKHYHLSLKNSHRTRLEPQMFFYGIIYSLSPTFSANDVRWYKKHLSCTFSLEDLGHKDGITEAWFVIQGHLQISLVFEKLWLVTHCFRWYINTAYYESVVNF